MDQIISSFKVKRTLCADFWETPEEEGAEPRLKPEIRSKLMEIAQAFIESLKLPDLDVEDIMFLGSLAGYNWSRYSDVDLHILVDKNSMKGDPAMVEEFFDAKKRLFNENHDITVKGYEVELYAQSLEEANESAGAFSVLYNKWERLPDQEDPEVDRKAIIKKVRQFDSELKSVRKMANSQKKLEKIDKLKEKIRKYRKEGLAAQGELGTPNLVFKYLRRSGYLEELTDLKTETQNVVLSLKEGKL